MKLQKLFAKLFIASSLLFISQSAFSVGIGCGFYTSTRQGACITSLSSSELATFQAVAVRVTQAYGQTYNYGGSNWSVGRSYIEIRYNLPLPQQVHTIAGSHCAQYFDGSYVCADSAPFSYYL